MTTSEPHVANHYTHFLRRLDRVAEGHVELAMALYTDHELLKLVLDRAKIPEGAERVAVSLESAHEGPFVVLTRGGAFVTCLGKNMKAHGLPVIRRHELEAAAADIACMREKLDRVAKLEREASEETTLARFRRIWSGAHPMSREDFADMVRFEPLFGDFFHEQLVQSTDLCAEIMPTLHRKHTTPRARAAVENLLECWWDLFWQTSNLHVIANMGAVHERCVRIDERVAISTYATGGAPLVQHAARAIWSAMRHVEPFLGSAETLDRSQRFTRVIRESTLTAIAIGSACGRRRALQQLACSAHETDEALTPFLKHARRDPEQAIDDFTLYAQETIAAERGGDPRDVPGDVARAMLVTGAADWMRDPVALHVLGRAVPWLAVADASELFVPAAWLEPVTFSPDRAKALMRSIADVTGIRAPAPAKRIATPERNERCACGSGQKYKRCCMRTPMRIAA